MLYGQSRSIYCLILVETRTSGRLTTTPIPLLWANLCILYLNHLLFRSALANGEESYGDGAVAETALGLILSAYELYLAHITICPNVICTIQHGSMWGLINMESCQIGVVVVCRLLWWLYYSIL